jgi:hypothetical protein
MTENRTPNRGATGPVRLRPVECVAAVFVIVVCVAIIHGSTISNARKVEHPETAMFRQHNERYVRTFADCFTAPPVYPGLYRPLSTTCYFYVGRKLFGHRIAPLKVVNIVVFLLNAFLLFIVCRQLLPLRWSLIAVVLFTTRKAHSAVILYSIEFQTLLSVFFALLALCFFTYSRRGKPLSYEFLSYLSLVLAVLSKEPAVAVVAVILTYGWLFSGRWTLRPYGVYVALAAGWWSWLLFSYRTGSQSAVGLNYSFHPLNVVHNSLGYFLSFFNFLHPAELSMRFGDQIQHAALSPAATSVFAFAALVCFVVVLVHKKLRFATSHQVRVIAFAFCFFFIAMLPYAILEDRLFVRYSYVGHAGLSMLVAGVANTIAEIVWRWGRRRRRADA